MKIDNALKRIKNLNSYRSNITDEQYNDKLSRILIDLYNLGVCDGYAEGFYEFNSEKND